MKITMKDLIKIIVGSALLAAGLDIFFASRDIVTGGVTGIGIILRYVTGKYMGYALPLSVSNLLINIPLLFIAWMVKGKRFIIRTAIATFVLSFFLYVFEAWTYTTGDLIVNAIFGAALSGLGLGLVFSSDATTGGTDLIAAVVHHYNKHISVASFLMLIDGIVVLAGVIVFGIDATLYAIIGVYLTSAISDRVVDGFHYSKAIYIISEHSEEIASAIMEQVERGVTGFQGKGMYTRRDKQVLLCTVSIKESIHIKQIVHTIDPEAFMIVTDAREVLGEGFVESVN